MTVIEMQVSMDCEGCENKIRNALKKLKGVHSIDIDRSMQKVTVSGFVDHRKVFKTVKNTGKMVQPWPYHGGGDGPITFNQYYNQPNPGGIGIYHSASSYYYAPPRSHSSNSSYFKRKSRYSYLNQPPYSETIQERPGVLFSDDNAVGCSIM